MITHFYSDYNNHENLNAKRNEWTAEIKRSRVLKWINMILNTNRNIYGYFDNCNFIISEIKDLKEASIKLEKYEITNEINYWLIKFNA